MARSVQKKMYETNAEKQAAYRARNRGKQPPLDLEICAEIRSVHEMIGIAALEGDVSAQRIHGRNAVETMKNVYKEFERIIANPGGYLLRDHGIDVSDPEQFASEIAEMRSRTDDRIV